MTSFLYSVLVVSSQGTKFIQRFDPVTYVKLTEQMDHHDISRGREGGVEGVLSRITSDVLVMGIDSEEAGEKFGFLLDAFTFGAPPHGGIAFGWDRITALLFGADSIRDVIAFPKSGGGVDPLTDAPAPITAQQRKESGMDHRPEKPPLKAAVSIKAD